MSASRVSPTSTKKHGFDDSLGRITVTFKKLFYYIQFNFSSFGWDSPTAFGEGDRLVFFYTSLFVGIWYSSTCGAIHILKQVVLVVAFSRLVVVALF